MRGGVPRWREQTVKGAGTAVVESVCGEPAQSRLCLWKAPGKARCLVCRWWEPERVQGVAGGGGRQEEAQGNEEGGTGERGEAEEGGLATVDWAPVYPGHIPASSMPCSSVSNTRGLDETSPTLPVPEVPRGSPSFPRTTWELVKMRFLGPSQLCPCVLGWT